MDIKVCSEFLKLVMNLAVWLCSGMSIKLRTLKRTCELWLWLATTWSNYRVHCQLWKFSELTSESICQKFYKILCKVAAWTKKISDEFSKSTPQWFKNILWCIYCCIPVTLDSVCICFCIVPVFSYCVVDLRIFHLKFSFKLPCFK